VIHTVHLFEVWNLVEIAQVDDGKILDALRYTVENFVLAHAVGVPVAAESDYDQAFVFGHDGLIDMPGGGEMREDDGTHLCLGRRRENRSRTAQPRVCLKDLRKTTRESLRIDSQPDR
jgi:hypothetical protein